MIMNKSALAESTESVEGHPGETSLPLVLKKVVVLQFPVSRFNNKEPERLLGLVLIHHAFYLGLSKCFLTG